MFFYRKLHPVYALTFDLDNTLYDHRLSIVRAEIKSLLFLQRYYPFLNSKTVIDFRCARKELLYNEPDMCHDVACCRWRAIKLFLLKYGIDVYKAALLADLAINIIIHWRNIFDVPEETHYVLSALSSEWPLVAITNGNTDLSVCSLKRYFDLVLYSGLHGRAKPYKDMYCFASKWLGVPCRNILHIGDDLRTDVFGALNSGLQSCWINRGFTIFDKKILKGDIFPHIEISKLRSLINLL